jgi:hypothetical protein
MSCCVFCACSHRLTSALNRRHLLRTLLDGGGDRQDVADTQPHAGRHDATEDNALEGAQTGASVRMHVVSDASGSQYSNLRAPNMRLECPQTQPDQARLCFRMRLLNSTDAHTTLQNYNPGPGHGRGVGCPMAYQVVSPKVRRRSHLQSARRLTCALLQPADVWDRSHDVVVNAFTMSIQTVADRVWYAGTNDSFVKEFWNRRVNITQVVTEMAAQVLIHNIGAWAEPCAAACLLRAMLTRTPTCARLLDRCTKNHVRWRVAAAFRMRALTLSCLLARCMRTFVSQTSGSSSHKTSKTVSPPTRVTATAAAQRKVGHARCSGAACAWLRMAACTDASCGCVHRCRMRIAILAAQTSTRCSCATRITRKTMWTAARSTI